MHWTVGKVKITKIVELETVGSTRFILPLATNEEIQKLPWLIPHFANEEGRLKMSKWGMSQGSFWISSLVAKGRINRVLPTVSSSTIFVILTLPTVQCIRRFP